MPIRDFPIPASPRLEAACEAYAASPADAAGPPIRPAATVMLLRDSPSGVEVFMQHRVASMAFAPQRHVFPGGGVDPRDASADMPWSGTSATEWAAVLEVPEDEARALVVAAVREVFEECGVLLTGPDRRGPARLTAAGSAARAAVVHAGREAIERRASTLGRVLTDLGLSVRGDLLGYHARWVTPSVEERRYDTHFFTAVIPPGQQADDATSEAQSADWVLPTTILRDAEEGRALLLPPTIVALESVAAAANARELVGRRSPVPVVRPIPVRTDTGWVLRAILP